MRFMSRYPTRAKHDVAIGLSEVLMKWLGPRLESRGQGRNQLGRRGIGANPHTRLFLP